MEYGSSARMYGMVWGSLLKSAKLTKEQRKKIKAEYRAITERAKDIGQKNRLLASYLLAAYFISFVRVTGMDPEKCYDVMEYGCRHSFILKHAFGNADNYLDPKKMPGRIAWDRETHERKYENDWVVDVTGPAPDYDLGYDYRECGAYKLCQDEGVPELCRYLCRLDFLLASFIGLELRRTGTIAEGADHCDFRYIRKKG